MQEKYEIIPHEEKRWTVYVHVNRINGKKYVGITGQNPNKRWGYHGCNYKTTYHFYNAIQKNGWDSFEHILVLQHLTQREANILEKLFIQIYKCNNKQYGYNLSSGGTGGNQKPCFGVKQYTLWGDFICEYPSAAEAARQMGIHRTNITHACKTNGTTHGFMWRYATDNNVQSYQRKNQRNVIQKDLNGTFVAEYISLSDASRKTGIQRDNLCRCLSKRNKSAGGYRWEYKEVS